MVFMAGVYEYKNHPILFKLNYIEGNYHTFYELSIAGFYSFLVFRFKVFDQQFITIDFGENNNFYYMDAPGFLAAGRSPRQL